MGHLGEGTQITTVQDKEIVLTGSDGQTFKMKVADLAEAVRRVMPVATSLNDGLMSVEYKKMVDNYKSTILNIKAGEMINYRYNENGAYFIIDGDTGSGAVVVVSSTPISYIAGDPRNVFSGNLNDQNKICIGRETTNGTVLLRNNLSRESNCRTFAL